VEVGAKADAKYILSQTHNIFTAVSVVLVVEFVLYCYKYIGNTVKPH